jgi:AraC-like DNA-binding protein
MTSHAMDRFRCPNAFWLGLDKLGLMPVTVLRQAGLSATVHGKKSLVTTAQFFALWRAVGELSLDPAAGLKLASQIEIGTLPPSSLAAYYARDYRDALTRMARHKHLCLPEEMRVTEGEDECVIELEWLHAAGEDTPPLLIDAAFASFLELGRRCTQKPLRPKRVELRRSREKTGVHAAYFDCPVKFGARRNALSLNSVDLDRPFVSYNQELLEMLQPQLLKASERRRQASVSEQVKWILKRLIAGNRPDIPTVARELGLSGRTLQRRIDEEGASFRQLILEARQELVRQYLTQTSMEINEVAYLLGYEDANSFYRAFRAWEGTTPAHWRARLTRTKRKPQGAAGHSLQGRNRRT